jgi:acetyltransferase
MKNLEKFFNPKSIAIVGASPKKEKLGNVLTRNIRETGWRGKIFLVNPKYARANKNYYASLDKIKKPVDLVLVAIPAPLVSQAIKEGAKARPRIENYAVISSGFREIGGEGKKLEEELKNIAEKYSLNILGPNCLGFINPSQKLNATFTSGKFKPGKVAIVSQSGALAVALLDWIQSMNVEFSKVISIGNKTVLDECDALNYLAADKNTQAIALYLEDIKDGARFIETVGKIGRKKPVVILKAGKTLAGQKAVTSHTGSLAQDEAVAEAVFEKLNIIEAKNIEELQDLILFLGTGKIPSRKEIVVLTNAGGPAVLATDFVGKSNCLELKKLSTGSKNKLKKYLPASASVENPIDIIGDAAPERYENALKVISQKYSQNPLLVILTPQTQTNPEKVAKIIKNYSNKFPIITTSFMGGVKVKRAVEYLRRDGIANFESPERALLAIEKIVYSSQGRKFPLSGAAQKIIHLKLKVNSIIQSALKKEKRKLLYWNETEKVFKNYGISLLESISFGALGELKRAKIKYPCVLKTDESKIIHRWGKKAVALDIQNKKELKVVYRKMKKSTGAKKFIIQTMAKPGLEIIAGLKRDKTFGPVIVVGWGGTMTEIFKDRIILVPPLTIEEAKNKLDNLKISPVLRGFRGEKKYDAGEIAKIVLALQEIAAENLDISQIDINPAMFYNDGSRYQILDAKVYL